MVTDPVAKLLRNTQLTEDDLVWLSQQMVHECVLMYYRADLTHEKERAIAEIIYRFLATRRPLKYAVRYCSGYESMNIQCLKNALCWYTLGFVRDQVERVLFRDKATIMQFRLF